jgi:hypothetical protein
MRITRSHRVTASSCSGWAVLATSGNRKPSGKSNIASRLNFSIIRKLLGEGMHKQSDSAHFDRSTQYCELPITKAHAPQSLGAHSPRLPRAGKVKLTTASWVDAEQRSRSQNVASKNEGLGRILSQALKHVRSYRESPPGCLEERAAFSFTCMGQCGDRETGSTRALSRMQRTH